ncbi:CDP-glycerol glycerophosphotransferase family protein [Streptomyces sp. NPDC001796]|uniref:bifunctional glycosyltransferase/CDP-glycerol:glycerophosphate glycerophosphotransferase n=1 Tax=Streptomyces sp. NPDC001796 TaxID=3364609 RepID=UPI00368FBA80
MPRFSVIVPAYKVQAYLEECLTSVLEQSFTDVEVIAVDDSSPDACGAIIDEFAARDTRVRPLHLPRNVGPGPARNAGLKEARGDYLLFLDGDDTLTPHALRDIADRLKETSDPDVLVFDHARTYWTGRTVRNQPAGLLTEQGPAPFRLDDRPGVLSLPTVPWNKAYRREFVEREGFAFPPGSHEDTPWTYPVLLTAETLATLDRVCVHWRRRRRGGTLGTTGRGHFDVFDQYDRVFAHLDAHPELARWRPVLFHRMADHLAAILARRGRLPGACRAEFLRLARAQYRRHRVPGAPFRLRHLLIRFGSHRTHRLLSLAARLARGVRRTLARSSRRLLAAALLAHYRIQLRLPLRADRAVFTRDAGGRYGCNPAALESAFRNLVPQIRTAWIARPEHHHTVPVATRRLRPGSAAYWTALARSKYLVHNADFDPRMVKRPGQILVQTRQGTPLKRMGLDLQDRPAAARDTDFARMLRTADTWDYVVSGNRHSTLVWERVFPSGFTTLEYGQPRNDAFARATSADVARLRQTFGIPEGSVAILYAPTYRDYRRGHRPGLDLERLLRRLGPRFVLLTRAHPACGGPLARTVEGRVVDVTGHPSVESVCLASDALVTDFSALMFDYANLDRPIIVYADDWEAYEAARGTYFDVRAFPPGPVAHDEDDLIDIFATGQWCGSRSEQRRAAFRKRFCPYDDGRAAERIVRRVVLGENAWQPAVVPLSHRRPVPSAAAGLPAPPLTSVRVPGQGRPVTERL